MSGTVTCGGGEEVFGRSRSAVARSSEVGELLMTVSSSEYDAPIFAARRACTCASREASMCLRSSSDIWFADELGGMETR